MSEHAATHSHHRADDSGKIVVPGWLKQVVGMTVTIILMTVALLSWMDNRYGKADVVEKKADKTEIQNLQGTLNEMKEDLKDIKRAMYRRPNP